VPVSPDLGPSRIVWLYRVGGIDPVAMGRLYNPEVMNPSRVLEPMRHIPPGRYAIQFGRYQHAWPVSLDHLEQSEDGRERMRVRGFVPL
jgi:hypothetical protein